MTADASPEDFGPRMKRAREAQGVSLRDIAARTKISTSALEALERNDISSLPGGIFGRAFVRAYAREVGLDPEQTIREFLERFPHETVTAGSPYVPDHHTAVERSRSVRTALKLTVFSLPVALGIAYFTVTSRPVDRDAPLPPAAPVAALPAPPVALAPIAIEMVAVSPVNVTLTADGAAQSERALTEGGRLTLSVERSLILAVANAAALHLTIDGQPALPLGAHGEARTIQIDRETLGSLLAPR